MFLDLYQTNPLFFAFFFPAAVDGIITLLGQDKHYWSKKADRKVNEASPAYYFLKYSPWLFVLGSIVWFVVWYYLFLIISVPINIFLTILFISGHSWGSGSWMMKMMRDSGFFSVDNQFSVMRAYGVMVLYLVLIAAFATLGIVEYFSL